MTINERGTIFSVPYFTPPQEDALKFYDAPYKDASYKSDDSYKTEDLYKSSYEMDPMERFKEDAVADEDFILWFDGSPISRVKRVDQTETDTLQILLYLRCLADRQNRHELEAITKPSAFSQLRSKSQDLVKSLDESYIEIPSIYRSRPFRRETNFYEGEILDQPIRTQHVIYNVIYILGKILFGYEVQNPQQDPRSEEKMGEDLITHSTRWIELKGHYTESFGLTMNLALKKAHELLKARRDYSLEAQAERIALYAAVIISIVGKIIGKKITALAGLAATVATFVFMAVRYGTFSFTQAKLTGDLVRTVEVMEKEAGRNRLI